MTMPPIAFPADGPVSVHIELQSGYVAIVTSPRDDVLVTVTPSNSRRAGDRAAAEQIQVDQKGPRISVTGRSRWNPFGASDCVDILIEAPEGSAVTAHVKYGSLQVTGPVGEVQAKVDYGDASIEASARLELRGGHGDMRIGRVEGDAQITLSSGAIRIGHVGQGLRIKGGHGSVDVGTVGGHADIATAGAIELGTAGAELSVRSAYGGVRVRDLVRGAARIEASYGAVHLGVRKGTAVWLDASSQHGAVRSDLASDPGPATDEEALKLRVNTTYGDIIIQRSAVHAVPIPQSEGANS